MWGVAQLTVLVRSFWAKVRAEAVKGSTISRAWDQHLLIQDPQQPPAVSPRAAGQHLWLPKNGVIPWSPGTVDGSQHAPLPSTSALSWEERKPLPNCVPLITHATCTAHHEAAQPSATLQAEERCSRHGQSNQFPQWPPDPVTCEGFRSTMDSVADGERSGRSKDTSTFSWKTLFKSSLQSGVRPQVCAGGDGDGAELPLGTALQVQSTALQGLRSAR